MQRPSRSHTQGKTTRLARRLSKNLGSFCKMGAHCKQAYTTVCKDTGKNYTSILRTLYRPKEHQSRNETKRKEINQIKVHFSYKCTAQTKKQMYLDGTQCIKMLRKIWTSQRNTSTTKTPDVSVSKCPAPTGQRYKSKTGMSHTASRC